MVIQYRLDIPADIADLISYDPDTGFFYKKECYFRSHVGRRADYAGSDGYHRIHIRKRMFFAHRLAWFFVFGTIPPMMIDHKNGVISDNRITNLRLATNSENSRNRRNPEGRSLPKGVAFNKKLGKFQAQIMLNKRTRYLGVFSTPDEAHAAYCAAAVGLHGDFARFS